MCLSQLLSQFLEILEFQIPGNWGSISSSSKTPRAGKHTNGCALKWEYGLPKFHANLRRESRVMPETVSKTYIFSDVAVPAVLLM